MSSAITLDFGEGPLGAGGSRREGKTRSYGRGLGLGQRGNQRLDDSCRNRGGPTAAIDLQGRKGRQEPRFLSCLVGGRAIGEGDRHRAFRSP